MSVRLGTRPHHNVTSASDTNTSSVITTEGRGREHNAATNEAAVFQMVACEVTHESTISSHQNSWNQIRDLR